MGDHFYKGEKSGTFRLGHFLQDISDFYLDPNHLLIPFVAIFSFSSIFPYILRISVILFLIKPMVYVKHLYSGDMMS